MKFIFRDFIQCTVLFILTYIKCFPKIQAKVTAKEREATENEHQLRQELRQTHELLSKSSQEVEQLRSELNLQVAASSEKQAQLINQEKDKILRVCKQLLIIEDQNLSYCSNANP